MDRLRAAVLEAARIVTSATGLSESDRPASPGTMRARLAQAHHRQQGLFLLVAARLAGGQAVGPAVRGDHRPDVRRGLGQAHRRRRIRAVGRQGADPVGRPDRDLGQPGDHRMARRQDRPGALLAARRRRPRHGPLDGGRDAFLLPEPAPRAVDERAQAIPDARSSSEPVKTEILRILELWAQARARHGGGGPYLFGEFGAVDIMFAPVVTRFVTYSIPVPRFAAAYMETILDHAWMQEWIEAAQEEPWVIEQYETPQRGVMRKCGRGRSRARRVHRLAACARRRRRRCRPAFLRDLADRFDRAQLGQDRDGARGDGRRRPRLHRQRRHPPGPAPVHRRLRRRPGCASRWRRRPTAISSRSAPMPASSAATSCCAAAADGTPVRQPHPLLRHLPPASTANGWPVHSRKRRG